MTSLCVIGARGGIPAVTRPIRVEKLAARRVQPLVGVRAEVVALSLEKIGRKPSATVAVIVFEGGAEGRCRHAVHDGLSEHIPPALLGLGELVAEIRVEKDVGDVRILVESLLNLAEEDTADDASASPHEGDSTVVEIPPVLLGGCAHEGIQAEMPVSQEMPAPTGEAPQATGGILRVADPNVRARVLLQTEAFGHSIVYRRAKRVNELIVDGNVYDEVETLIEYAHTLKAQVDGHLFEAEFDGKAHSYIKVDGQVVAKKLRLM